MAIDKSVGQKIRYLRRKKNMTQTNLGVAVFNKSDSASQNTIKNIETGRRNTKPDELNEILSELNISKLEFNELSLKGDPEKTEMYKDDTLLPELEYYNKMYKQALNAGDEYMILQIYKAMANKIDEKITLQQQIVNKPLVEKDESDK